MSDRLDDAALLALGVLPEAEARALAMEILTDAEALAEYRYLRSAADAIGLAADDAAPSAEASGRMRAALLAQVRTEAGGATPASAAYVNGTASNVRRLPERASAPPRSSLLLGLAAAAAIALAIFTGFDDLHQRDSAREAIASADAAQRAAAEEQRTIRDTQSALAVVADASAKRYAVNVGTVVAGRSGIVLAMNKLPALPPGKVYQAWTLTRGGKSMTPSVTFSPDSGGAAVVNVPADPSKITVVAVSVEPEGGSKAPTSHPTFVRTLT